MTPQPPGMEIDKVEALSDEPVRIAVSGFVSGERVEISSDGTGFQGNA